MNKNMMGNIVAAHNKSLVLKQIERLKNQDESKSDDSEHVPAIVDEEDLLGFDLDGIFEGKTR